MNLKHCEIVTDKDKLNVNIEEVCRSHKSIKLWAYILHDKDETRPHYHIYLNFGSASQDTAKVAKWFDIAENFISRIKGKKSDALKYLTHSNESQKGKSQYSASDIVANFDVQVEIEMESVLGNFINYSYAQQIEYVHNLPLQYRDKAFLKLDQLWKLECKYQSQKTCRNIQVVFITGDSGTGKTTYAKQLCDSLGYDYAVSSSNNDSFQDYQGQKAFIFDDLRDSAFSLTDLLKILDNNTASSIKSRYNNKVFNGKLIIITSCKPLMNWYNGESSNVSEESLYQLYRRINTYIKVTEGTIFIYDKIDKKGCPVEETCKGLPNVIENMYPKNTNTEDTIDCYQSLYNHLKSMPCNETTFKNHDMFMSMGMKYVEDDEVSDADFGQQMDEALWGTNYNFEDIGDTDEIF